MALGAITIVKDGVIGDMKYKVATFTLESSYVTTGTSLLASAFGLNDIFQINFELSQAAATVMPIAAYDYTNRKLQCFSTAAGAAGFTETTAATNLSTVTIRAFVTGK